jgi:hypothetical protein
MIGCEAAPPKGLDPLHLSFIRTLRIVRRHIHLCSYFEDLLTIWLDFVDRFTAVAASWPWNPVSRARKAGSENPQVPDWQIRQIR